MQSPLHLVMTQVFPLLLLLLLLVSCTLLGQSEETLADSEAPPSDNDVLTDSPRFVVKLPDDNLLCFAIDGFELFAYNLITSHYLIVNGFLNLAEYRHKDTPGPSLKKGFTEIGVIVRSIDRRMKGGSRVLKHKVSGPKKKAFLDKFGEVDIHQGAVVFSLDQDGHSSIESEQAKHETFLLKLDKPKVVIRAVSGDSNTFSVYVEDSSGLISTGSHGLIGQFLSPKVRINTVIGELTISNGSTIAVEKGIVWGSLRDGVYPAKRCWYPKEQTSVVQGNSFDYILEHIMSTKYKHTLF